MLLNKFDNPIESCEIKMHGTEGVFEGYASVWGRVDSYGDTVLKGAFESTLQDRARPPMMLYGHSPGRVIGKWTDMKEDATGLRVSGELTPNHTDAMNIKASMEHGAITGLSIGFRINQNGAEDTDEGRILKDLDLVEVSVVSMPAESEARIDTVKSEIFDLGTIRDVELWLREAAAFPRSMAKDFMSQLRDIYQREADEDARRQIESLHAEAKLAEGQAWVTETINHHFGKIL